MERVESRGRAATDWVRRLAAVTVLAAGIGMPGGRADDSDATRSLTEARDQHRQSVALAEARRVEQLARRYRRDPESIRRIVRAAERAGERHGLSATLLLAIVETESSFNPGARSGYGARGLMQVVPRHHPAEIAAIGGPHRLEDPDIALDVGARILSGYIARSGSLEHGLRRYSGGARRYADKVLARQTALEQDVDPRLAAQPLGRRLADRSAARRG